MRLLLLGLILSIVACDDFCPPDEQVGTLELSTATRSFNPYTSDTRLVFENTSGDSLVFLAPQGAQRNSDQLCVQELCTEPKIKGA